MRAGYKAPTGLPKDSALDLVPELIESQNAIVVRDSLILCAFAKGASPDDMLAKAWTAITGDEASWADLCARAGVQWDLARPGTSRIGVPSVGTPPTKTCCHGAFAKSRSSAAWPRAA